MVALPLIALIFQLADPWAAVHGGNVSTSLRAVNVQATCAAAQSETLSLHGNLYGITGILPNNCSAVSYAPASTIGTWYGWGSSFSMCAGDQPEPNCRDGPRFILQPCSLLFL